MKLIPELRRIVEPRMKEPDDLIFTQPNGKMITVSTLNTHFKKICKNAGIRLTTVKKKKANGTYCNLLTSERIYLYFETSTEQH